MGRRQACSEAQLNAVAAYVPDYYALLGSGLTQGVVELLSAETFASLGSLVTEEASLELLFEYSEAQFAWRAAFWSTFPVCANTFDIGKYREDTEGYTLLTNMLRTATSLETYGNYLEAQQQLMNSLRTFVCQLKSPLRDNAQFHLRLIPVSIPNPKQANDRERFSLPESTVQQMKTYRAIYLNEFDALQSLRNGAAICSRSASTQSKT